MLGDTNHKAMPLLVEAEFGPVQSRDKSELPYTPHTLATVQLGILCFLRTLDPMSFTQIFPYVNEFISDLRVTEDPARIGFYSGLLESSFCFTQLLSIYPWGFLSDHIGRRPVILVGVGGLAMTTLLFGLSSSFPTALLARAAAGLFAGNVTTIPSMLCELTNEKNQAFAFSFFGFWWPLGAIVGSLIGGFLSNPASRYTNFLDCRFLRKYPYFLPCISVTVLATIGFILSWLFLRETLPNYEKRSSLSPSYGTMDDEESAVRKNSSVKELLSAPILRALCASGLSLSFMSASFDVLFVLFCFTPVNAGGLSFSSSQIGFALSLSGGIAAFLQVFFMPTILNRVSHTTMYHFCMKIWPYSFITMPFLNLIARWGTLEGRDNSKPLALAVLWISIAVVLAMTRVAFLAYSVNMLLIKRFTPDTSSLGTTMSLVQICICFSRAISPAFTSATYAFSVQYHIFGGYLWVIIMVLIGLTSSRFSATVVLESSKLYDV